MTRTIYMAINVSSLCALGLLCMCGCSPRPKAAREKFTISSFKSAGELRTDGFYYRIGRDTPVPNTDVGRYYIAMMYLYDDGICHISSGFSTNDSSQAAIKEFAEKRFVQLIQDDKSGWGRYSINGGNIEMEYFYHRSSGLSNLGLVKLSGVVADKSTVIFQRYYCSWCSPPPPPELNPEEKYVFVQSGIKPDSSKAFFNRD